MRLQQFRYCLFLQGFCICLVCGQGQAGVDSSPGVGWEASTSAGTDSESDGYSIGSGASPSTVDEEISSSSYDFSSNNKQSTSPTPSNEPKTSTLSPNSSVVTNVNVTTQTTPTITKSGSSTTHNANSTTSISTTTPISSTAISTGSSTTHNASSTTSISTTTPISSTTISTTTTTPISSSTISTRTTEPPCIRPISLNISILSTFKTSVNVNVSLVYSSNQSNGTFCPTRITITCKAINPTQFPWIVPYRNSTLELSSNESYGEDEIKDLSEYTTYTCRGNDYSNLSSEFSFTTLEEVPSKPLGLVTTPLNATSLSLTWKEPYKVPSILEGYRVNITRLKEASEGHFCCNCSYNDRLKIINTKETNVTFYEALADFEYQISVEALSNVGYGNATTKNVITPISASEPPTNVIVTPNEEEQERNVLFTLNLSWNMPCNTNGPAKYFNIVLSGVYNLNDSVPDPRMETLDILPNTTSYLYSFSDILPATKYTVTIFAMTSIDTSGMKYEEWFETNTNFPSSPIFEKPEVNAKDFTLTWMEPSNNPGPIENYILNVTGQGVNYKRTQNCHKNTNNNYNMTQVTEFSYEAIPDAKYLIYLSAETTRGQGNMTNMTILTKMADPDDFILYSEYHFDNTTELYDDNVTLKFKPGCFNGKFKEIVVHFTGTRINFDDHKNTESNLSYDTESYTFNVKPEYSYDVSVTVKNEQFSTNRSTSFMAQAGVPVFNSSIIKTIQIVPDDSKTTLVLKKEDFDNGNGQVKFLAIIVSDKNVTGGEFSKWEDNSQWPTLQRKDGEFYYQVTPTFWNPFKSSNTTNFTIGETEDCPPDVDYCNRLLEPGTQYYVLIRIFNVDYYRNTMPIRFKTLTIKRLGLILGVIFGLLAASCAAFAVFIMWRKGLIRVSYIERVNYNSAIQQNRDLSTALLSNSSDNEQMFERHNSTPALNTEENKFIEHCKLLEDSPEALRAEWAELEEQSKPIYEELPCGFATLKMNQRKNRYTNILPYDHSRVKLNIVEDDEMSSDYINASYIKGVLNENAYIATQGPLPGTCKDFWKMILQEGISIIVMVSKFIENNRDKCYKYFPNNRETMTLIGDDIEVRCSMELNFGFYCIRTLQVKKELRQVTVTHLQYLEWPDFGVPVGTDSMLQFCQQFKERWATLGGMAVIHCSAGVGRTGTLIATDILLRNVRTGRKIDVFNTVLELRRQRKSMVQTEIQYKYIYQLIRSMLECPILDEDEIPTEPVYANVDLDDEGRKGIVETAL